MKLNTDISINATQSELSTLFNLASCGALNKRNQLEEKSVKWIYYDELRKKYDALQVDVNSLPKVKSKVKNSANRNETTIKNSILEKTIYADFDKLDYENPKLSMLKKVASKHETDFDVIIEIFGEKKTTLEKKAKANNGFVHSKYLTALLGYLIHRDYNNGTADNGGLFIN